MDVLIQLKQVVNGLGYRMELLFPEMKDLTTSPVHENDVIHGDLTNVGILRRYWFLLTHGRRQML
jgi:hypothetical protein